ncbi:13067_t:CDS:2, partial [Acaulospora morrowiae]
RKNSHNYGGHLLVTHLMVYLSVVICHRQYGSLPAVVKTLTTTAVWESSSSPEKGKTHITTLGIYWLPSYGLLKHRLRNEDINYFWNRIEQQRLESERATRTIRCHVNIRSKTQDMMENMADETIEEAEIARKRLHSEFSRHKQNEEGFSTPPNKIRTSNRMFSNEGPSTIRDPKMMSGIFDENIASDMKEKVQRSTSPFLSKKRACNTQQEDEKGITVDDLANSVIDASNTFGQVEFPSYYSKLKSIWDKKDATNYHVIDLGDKDTLYNVHKLLDEDELKSLFKRLVLDDEDMHIDEKTHKYIELFDQIIEDENLEDIFDDVFVDEIAGNDLVDENNEETKSVEGDNEKFNKTIAKMKEIVHQLDGLSEKYHYLSNTLPISAQYYNQSKMPDMFIVKNVSSHLDNITRMNGAMKNTPERTWTAHRTISTKMDVQENNFKADGVLEFFERPMQIPLFLLEVSEGPNNPDPDKINEDREKLMNEGVFAINKFMTKTGLPTWEVCSTLKIFLAQGFGDNVEIGQMIFIGPGLYLFSPFTIPALVISTSTDNLEHVPRLIRTLLCLRYNVLKEVKMFEKFKKEGQRRIAKPKTKYPTGVTPERPKAIPLTQNGFYVPDIFD